MVEAISAARLSEIIGLIYSCAIDPSRWPVALEAIRLEVGGANASLDLVTIPDGASVLNVMTNIPAPYCDTMLDYSADVFEIWGGLESMCATPLDRPASLLRTSPDHDRMNRTRLRAEWAAPQGINDMLGAWLARDDQMFGMVGFGRLDRDGPYGDRELEIMSLLVPHLQRAASINRLLDLAALQQASFTALFDTLETPVLLVGRGMRLVHQNASARALIARGTPLFAAEGHLAARDFGTHRALVASVAQAAADHAALDRKGLGIPLHNEDGSVGALHVLPLSAEDRILRWGALAAVFVARASTSFVAPTEIVAALFGLTLGERRVFAHVAAGRSIPHTAQALGVGDSTVKTHVLRLYEKIGVRRQAELVQLAASLRVPIAH